MADITIQKQGEVFISQSEYDALRLAGNLQSNTKYHITKTPKTGIDTMTNLDLTYGNTTVDYNTTDGITINGQDRFTYNGGTTKDVTMDIDLPIVAGEGITIDKKSTEEKVEVKLDTALTDGKYVAKQTKGGGIWAYIVNGNDNQDMLGIDYAASRWSLAWRGEGGTLKVGTAVEDSDAMPKKQVEDGFVKSYVGTSSVALVYIRNGSYDSVIPMNVEPDENSIAHRGTGGTLKVGTPVGVNDATTKAYVDGLHHYTHHIAIKDGTSEIYITLAIKNYPNAVTTLDGVTELVEALTGQMQPIMATGVVDGHNIHAVFVQADQKLYVRFYDSTTSSIKAAKVTLFPGSIKVNDTVA